MRHRSSELRSGFTLLEVLLASLIAVLLMAGLYVALDVQLRQANEARQIVQQATVARAIINRISADLTPVLTPISQTASSSSSSAGGGSGGSDSSSTGGSTSGTGGTGGSSGSTSGASANSANATADPGFSDMGTTSTAINTYYPPQIGVMGDSSSVMLFVTRVPNPSGTDVQTDIPPTAPDIRRVVYRVEEGTGLIRQQSFVLTADASMESESKTEIVASEVTGIELRYWDGSGWLSEWYGSDLSEDMQTPKGPPMAIELRIWIKQPNKNEPVEFRHTIALHTAPTPVQTTTTTIQPIP